MRTTFGFACALLVACEPAATPQAEPAPIELARSEPAPAQPPSVTPGAEPTSPPVVAAPSASPSDLRIVARRTGAPIALERSATGVIARATAEVIALSKDAPLDRDPRVLVGLVELVEGLQRPEATVTAFGGRWPHSGYLVATVSMQDVEGQFTRALRWDGGTWSRDEVMAGRLKHFDEPIGPFSGGTDLARPRVELVARHRRSDLAAIERVQQAPLVRRPLDGSRLEGPPLPMAAVFAFASLADGHVFAGADKLAVWRPGATAWAFAEIPDGKEPWIIGFDVRAPNDAVAFGQQLAFPDASSWMGRYGPYLAGYDGTTWASRPTPASKHPISAFVSDGEGAWALCNLGPDEGRPGGQGELWHAGRDGRWQAMELRMREDGTSIALEPKAEAASARASASEPRVVDLAVDRDGTLWLVVSDAVTGGWGEPTWWLARRGPATRVLVLPDDPELFAALPR